jgi:hypothetical protein
MFKKLAFFIFFCTCISNSFSQEKIAFISDFLKNKNSYLDDTITIENPENDNTSIFFMQKKRVFGFLLDNDFKILDSLNIEDKERKYQEIIGKQVIENNTYCFYLSNDNQKKFARLSFSFETDTSEFQEIDLDLGKEKFLHSIHYNNSFIIATIEIENSYLHFYKFTKSIIPQKITLNLNGPIYYNAKGKEVTLYELFAEGTNVFNATSNISLAKIDQQNPNSLETTSKFSKMYVRENMVIFTFDEHTNFTQTVSINLENFEYHYGKIKKPLQHVSEKKKKNNTFLYNENLFVISATDDILMLSQKNYYDDLDYKNHTAISKDSIYFKNTPIIQTGGAYTDYREMEGTKKFLRKINQGVLGISVFKNETNYTVTYGGLKQVSGGGGFMMPGMAGVPIAGFGAASVFVNPMMFASNGYSNSRAVKINGLFDEDFNHLPGSVPENIFDIINTYDEENNIDPKGKTIFKHNDNYILGHYVSWTKIYELVQF